MNQAQHADAFFNRWNGKKIDEDGYYGTQCWDLAAAYAREEYGCPSLPTGSGGAEGVYRLFQNPIGQYFDRIANSPDPNNIPQKGDLVVWTNKTSPPWGHIALVMSANSTSMTVFEQNGGIDYNKDGIADGTAYTINRGYANVAGWLRPKAQGETMSKVDINLARILSYFIGGRVNPSALDGKHDGDLNKNHVGKETNQEIWDWYQSAEGQAWKNKINVTLLQAENIASQLATANTTIAALTSQISDLNKRPTEAQLEELKKAAEAANEAMMKAQAELEKKKEQDAEADKQTKGFFRALWRLITGKDA